MLSICVMVFTSCSNDESDNNPIQSTSEIESMLVGKWKSTVEDSEEVLTDRRSVRTYFSDGTTYISFSRKFQALGFQWASKYLMSYQIKDDILTVKNPSNEKSYQFQIIDIGDDFANYMGIQPASGIMKTVRVSADYSNDILGLWEGVEMTGDETFGNVEARIEYKADGTYIYYKRNGDDWTPSINVDNEYNIDGDWLATRWRPKAGADFNYEWWDIDYIKDGIMKWSALREKNDGTRFTTTFTWKKIK